MPKQQAGRSRLMAVLLATGLIAGAACSSSDSSSSTSTSPGTTSTTTGGTRPDIPAAEWESIETGLAELAPRTGLLVAEVDAQGTCRPVHAVAATTARPIASQFKLLVLGALAEQIEAGEISWDQQLVVPQVRSLGNEGVDDALQASPENARFTVEHVATQMIAISDNTAADLLVDVVGRDAVEAQFAKWTDHADRNTPLLKTREMLLLHYSKGLGEEYLATPQPERDAFLDAEVDPRPNADIGTGYTTEPRLIDQIEWLASPQDLCRTFAGLHQLGQQETLAPLGDVLAEQDFGVDLDPDEWPTVWYKGGSEPGVLTTGWLATNAAGNTFVVEMMLANPDAALSPESIPTVVELAKQAFGLLAAD